MTKQHSLNCHAAKERRRMADPAPDYLPELDYSSPVESWTFKDYRRNRVNKLVLFHSRRRRGCFRVVVNGEKEFSKCIGYDRLMRKVVKSLSRI
jgi:hypothetical protein